jgi:tetratricopeptide (TPR) repeat protein
MLMEAPAGSAASAPSANPGATSDTVPVVSLEDLRAFALTDKSEYVLGEPVFLKLVLANWSQKNTFELQGYLHPANDFEIKVARSRELPRRFMGGAKKDVLFPGATFVLRPREVNAMRWTLCYEPDHPSGFLFSQAGLYTIACQARVTINQTPRVLTLPEFQIEIKEPTAEQKRAVDRIMRPDCADDLQRMQAKDETAKIWQEMTDEFPKSPWAPYAKLLLARRALESGKSDYAAMFKQFEAIARAHPDFVLLDDVYYFCASCQDRLGQPFEALRWLYRIQREFPVSPYVQASNRLFRKYIYSAGWEQRYAPWYLRE